MLGLVEMREIGRVHLHGLEAGRVLTCRPIRLLNATAVEDR